MSTVSRPNQVIFSIVLYNTRSRLSMEWVVIKNNTSFSLGAGKNKCEIPSFKPNPFYLLHHFFGLSLDLYSLEQEFYPTYHVYPLAHAEHWSANNFARWIDDFDDPNGSINSVLR